MVLLIAIGAAAAAYQAQQNNNNGGASDDSKPSENVPPLNLTGKTAVDLLPLERTLALFEAPISTITFMDGDPVVAAEFLKHRVAEVAYRNPWLGGWLRRGPLGHVRLIFDPSSDDLCDGLFKSYDVETIKLTRETPFEAHGEIFEQNEVKVKINADVIDCDNSPLWRVSLIPDAEYPTSKFALVVSMSHMLGDGHTFFRILDMLHTSGNIETLNPIRKHELSTEAAARMGRDEVYYVDRVSRSPIWANWGKPDETIMELRVFYIKKEWVEEQKKLCSMLPPEAAQSSFSNSGNISAGLGAISEGDDDNSEQDIAVQSTEPGANDPKIAEDSTPPTTRQHTVADRAKYRVSFASKQATEMITTNDIITSAFFKETSATVGLMPYNFRGRPGMSCDDRDAGNYSFAIPYTTKDFSSPAYMQLSRQTARRAHADDKDDPSKLPPHKRDNRYSIAVDWRSFQRKGGLTLGENSECTQHIQLPCYDKRKLDAMPKTFSFYTLFNAGPHGEPAMSVIAPQGVMEKIETSGIVEKQLVATTGTSEDVFAENVADTVAGKRPSVFASLIDVRAMSGIEEELETVGEKAEE